MQRLKRKKEGKKRRKRRQETKVEPSRLTLFT
jgi:hypothetical protein